MTEFNLNESLFNEEVINEEIINEEETLNEEVVNEEEINEKITDTSSNMIGRPTKPANLNKISTHNKVGIDADGRIPKDEAWILIKLYEATVDPGNQCDVKKDIIDPATGEVIGFGGISRKNLLKLCGNANYDDPGEASTFFSGLFKDLNLAKLEDGIVYPGPNLRKWLDNEEVFYIPEKKRYGTQVGKEYAHEPNMRRFLGAGNVGRKTASSATERNRPNPLADLKGIKLEQPVEEPVNKPNAVYSSEKPEETGVYTSTDNDFEQNDNIEWNETDSFDWGDTDNNDIDWGDVEWTPINQEEEKKVANESLDVLENKRIAEVKSAYRQKCNLEEDAEINDDNFDSFALSAVCMKHNWPFAKSKERLFSKGI